MSTLRDRPLPHHDMATALSNFNESFSLERRISERALIERP
jgi:hypothetical protein